MAIFGGFMTIVSILGFFLTVIWFVLPFVIFSIKGRVDRSADLLEDIDKRLAALEEQLRRVEGAQREATSSYEPTTPDSGALEAVPAEEP